MASNKKDDSKWDMVAILITVIIALSTRFFIFELFYVPTGSMKQTILEGDYVVSTKYSYGFSRYSFPFSPNLFAGRIFSTEPVRGDITIFRPPHNMGVRYVKRLIGLPGEKVRLQNDLIYINDIPIIRENVQTIEGEGGIKYEQFKEILPNGVSYFSYKLVSPATTCNSEEYIIPEGNYFFLGDNRDESNDSRYDLGFVPFENFIAKARFILISAREMLFSFKDGAVVPFRLLPWLDSFRMGRIFKKV